MRTTLPTITLQLALIAQGCGAGEQARPRAAARPSAARVEPARGPVATAAVVRGWSRLIGSDLHDTVAAVALASDGAIVIAGQFEGEIAIGSDTLVSAGETDAYVAVLEPDGSPRWATSFGGTGFDSVGGVAAGEDGALLVAGDFTGTMTYGERRLVARDESDVFVAALGANGDPLWGSAFGGPGWQIAAAVAPVPGGAAVAYTSGQIAMSELGAEVEAAEAAVARIDDTGEVAWQRRTAGSGWAQAHAIDVTRDGRIVLAASQASPEGDRAGLLAGYDLDGALLWTSSVGGSDDEAITALDTSDEPLLFAGASVDARVALDSTTAESARLLLGAVASRGSDLRYATVGVTPATARSLVRLPGGDVLVAGNGPPSPLGRGFSEAVVARTRPDAAPRELLRVRGTFVSVGGAVVADGMLVVGGTFIRHAQTPRGELEGRGGLDGFVVAVPLEELMR